MARDRPISTPKEVDEYTKKLIKQFRKNLKATEHDPLYKITPEEYNYFWKGATEWTSCGCDILHLGTQKEGSFSETITELDNMLADIPLQTGYSPLRWRAAIDVLLPEKVGVTLLEKMRTLIVIFQGEFDYLNKYIGRHMMKDGASYEQLSWENMGSMRERMQLNNH
jgi:hypothetical protein